MTKSGVNFKLKLKENSLLMSLLKHQEELDFLEKLGFPINPYNQPANNLEEVWSIAQNLKDRKNDLNYPIDGLVVKLNDNQLVETLGIVGKTRRGWCAIKYPADEVTTKILDVVWQVGRTGRVTPVASLEPVLLAGTKVKRATLHNYKEFIEKNLQAGDTLIIRKAGEIIPEVVQVLYNLRTSQAASQDLPVNTSIEHFAGLTFEAPKICPICQTELVESSTGVDLLCKNVEYCQAQIVGRLSYYCQRDIGGLTGLSEKQLEKFVENFKIQDIPDLFDLPYKSIKSMEGHGDK